MNENIKKFGEAEIILGISGALIVDGICALVDLTGVGTLITPLIQSGTMFCYSLWLHSKGDKNALKFNKQIIKQVSNLIPVLPTVTAVFLIDVIVHNNPKIARLAGAATGGGMKTMPELPRSQYSVVGKRAPEAEAEEAPERAAAAA